MNVTNPTTRPRRIFGKDVEMAALGILVEDPSDEADGRELDVEVAPVLLTATLRS
jgi:hypothetical protein